MQNNKEPAIYSGIAEGKKPGDFERKSVVMPKFKKMVDIDKDGPKK
jgi:hypothetical protein